MGLVGPSIVGSLMSIEAPYAGTPPRPVFCEIMGKGSRLSTFSKMPADLANPINAFRATSSVTSPL